jgi:hypothetical protein
MTRRGQIIIWSAIVLMTLAMIAIICVHVKYRIDVSCDGEFSGRTDDDQIFKIHRSFTIQKINSLLIISDGLVDKPITASICWQEDGVVSFNSGACVATSDIYNPPAVSGHVDIDNNNVMVLVKTEKDYSGQHYFSGIFECKRNKHDN